MIDGEFSGPGVEDLKHLQRKVREEREEKRFRVVHREDTSKDQVDREPKQESEEQNSGEGEA